jgi:serine/threonine protein kinase
MQNNINNNDDEFKETEQFDTLIQIIKNTNKYDDLIIKMIIMEKEIDILNNNVEELYNIIFSNNNNKNYYDCGRYFDMSNNNIKVQFELLEINVKKLGVELDEQYKLLIMLSIKIFSDMNNEIVKKYEKICEQFNKIKNILNNTIPDRNKEEIEWLENAKILIPKHINKSKSIHIASGSFGNIHKYSIIDSAYNETCMTFVEKINNNIYSIDHILESHRELKNRKKLKKEVIEGIITFVNCESLFENRIFMKYYAYDIETFNRNFNFDENEKESLIGSLILQISKGLATLHKMELIHGDIKPENIFLSYERKKRRIDAVIGDLGGIGLSHEKHTMTRNYVDPEYKILHKLSDKSDIYAFGKTINIFMFNEPIYTFHNLVELMCSNMRNDRPSANEIINIINYHGIIY